MLSQYLLLPWIGLSADAERPRLAAYRTSACTRFILFTIGIVLSCWAANPGVAAETGTPIQLEPDLKIVAAIRQGDVDLEGLRIIDAVNDDSVVLRLSWSETEDSGSIDFKSVLRVLRREDLANANRIVASFHSAEPELLPGSTALQTSAAVLQSLDAGKETPIIFGIASGAPNAMLAGRKYYRGNLHKVANERFPLLLDGERTTVPVIHAAGTLSVGKQSGEAEFWWLDQADNPLTLRWTFLGDTMQVVRIDRPVAPAKPLPGLQSEDCRAELHGIYFDTASATLLPSSDTALGRVATLLNEHPDWIVTVEGHTDSIGDIAANQALSEARASAVRDALVRRFKVAPGQLAAEGYGETRPVESNETLEGRAHNRRVELARNCAS